MQEQITVLIDRWLRHVTYGVEAMMARVPNLTPEAVDKGPVVMPSILNDIEYAELAGSANLDPPVNRAIIVYTDSPVAYSMNASRTASISDSDVRPTIGWMTRDEDPIRAVNDGSVLLRAIVLSLFKWNDQVASRGYRDLNGVKVAKVNSVRSYRVAGAVGKSRLWGFVQPSLIVIDTLTG
jgi:hypothetical protein